MASTPDNSPIVACLYAALILFDDDIQVTVENMKKILKAANVKVDDYLLHLINTEIKRAGIPKLITYAYTDNKPTITDPESIEESLSLSSASFIDRYDPSNRTKLEPESITLSNFIDKYMIDSEDKLSWLSTLWNTTFVHAQTSVKFIKFVFHEHYDDDDEDIHLNYLKYVHQEQLCSSLSGWDSTKTEIMVDIYPQKILIILSYLQRKYNSNLPNDIIMLIKDHMISIHEWLPLYFRYEYELYGNDELATLKNLNSKNSYFRINEMEGLHAFCEMILQFMKTDDISQFEFQNTSITVEASSDESS